jgi:hypothetical protein
VDPLCAGLDGTTGITGASTACDRSLSTGLPFLRAAAVQAASFDAAEESTAPAETANRNDFLKLLAFVVSPETFSDDGQGKVGISYTAFQRLTLGLSANEPKLRQALTDALPEDQQKGLLSDLDLRDDWSLEAKARLMPWGDIGIARQLNRHFLSNLKEEEPRFEELLAGSFRAFLASDPDLAELNRQRLSAAPGSKEAERAANALVEGLNEIDSADAGDFLSGFLREVTAQRAGDLNILALGYQNNLQVHATARYRDANSLIAPVEMHAGLTAQWGWPKLERNASDDEVNKWLAKHRNRIPHSFAAEAAWTDKEDASFNDDPTLGQEAMNELKASLNWTTKLFRRGLRLNGAPVGADQSLTLSYLSPSGNDVSDRFIVNETIVFHLSDTISVPLSLIYANKQEFIEADEVRGRIGLSFAFRNESTGQGN